MKIQINGQARDIDVPDTTPLLWVLRDELGMTGTKFGCGMALCGACTVHMDGAPIRACITPVSATAGQAISTIESMETDRVGKVVQQAWLKQDVPQCGYCQPGQIMSACALLASHRAPKEAQINEAMSGNLCRCGTYNQIKAAIQGASAELVKGA